MARAPARNGGIVILMSRLHKLGLCIAAIGALALSPLSSQTPPRPKRVLAWGDTMNGFQHDSISHALATMERLGRESGAYEMYIRTDSQLVTKHPIPEPARNTRNLTYFDAIFYYGTGNGENMTAEQKADLMSFIKEDGKGFIGAHTGDDAFFDWPEFGEMIGGYFDNHPWNQFDAPIVIEDGAFPAMKHFAPRFTLHDEIYEHKNFSRDKVHVLASLDATKLDYTKPNIHRADHDFPVAWTKMHGKGRVFYSTFGHAAETWDNPIVQKMYFEATRWALRLVGDDSKIGK